MNVLIVTTSHGELGNTGKKTGFYLSELTHVYYPLRAAGAHITVASLRGGRPPIDGADRSDTDNARFLADEAALALLATTPALATIDPAGFDAVYFPGGHGTMWDFPGDPHIERVARAIWERGGVVAAVCHGPAALTEIRLSSGKYLVAGREVAAFTNEEERAVGLAEVVPFLLHDRLAERGAQLRLAAPWQANAVVSDRLVTGQNPQSAREVSRHMLELLAVR
jgi:putative intracellular protease/amidase